MASRRTIIDTSLIKDLLYSRTENAEYRLAKVIDVYVLWRKPLGTTKSWKIIMDQRVHVLEGYCRNHTLNNLIEFKDYPFGDAVVAIKLAEKWRLLPRDVVRAKNQDLRQRALKEVGADRFLQSVKARVVHKDRFGKLVTFQRLSFVQVVDPSTNKIYMLQVPNEVKKAKEAVAWTFGMDESQYEPEYES